MKKKNAIILLSVLFLILATALIYYYSSPKVVASPNEDANFVEVLIIQAPKVYTLFALAIVFILLCIIIVAKRVKEEKLIKKIKIAEDKNLVNKMKNNRNIKEESKIKKVPKI